MKLGSRKSSSRFPDTSAPDASVDRMVVAGFIPIFNNVTESP
jgi:hypothetical protein